MNLREILGGPAQDKDDILNFLGEKEYSIVIKNGKKHLLKKGQPTMRTGYDSFFIRDGAVWGKIGIQEDLIIAPEKIDTKKNPS